MTYLAAVAQCESDGALLAFPRSEAENNFIASLLPSTNRWIGIDDIEEEGKFVSSDKSVVRENGLDLLFTKWFQGTGEPNNWQGNEDAVRFDGVGGRSGYWNDFPVTDSYEFVCFYKISESQNYKPEDYQLPSDYTFASKSWGDFFYKIHGSKATYTAAKAQCESDGAVLAYPVSQAANDFIVSLIPGTEIWIGIEDIDQEGKFVSVDGGDYWATPNWANNQPDNHNNNEDAVFILGFNDPVGQWVDASVTSSYRFVCTLGVSNYFSWSEWSQCTRSTTSGDFIKNRKKKCLNNVERSQSEICSFEVWYGETDIATYTVGSVNGWRPDLLQPEMMFDGDATNHFGLTLWISEPCQIDRSNCWITINFKVSGIVPFRPSFLTFGKSSKLEPDLQRNAEIHGPGHRSQ